MKISSHIALSSFNDFCVDFVMHCIVLLTTLLAITKVQLMSLYGRRFVLEYLVIVLSAIGEIYVNPSTADPVKALHFSTLV